VVKPVTAKRMEATIERLKLQMNSRVLAQAPEAINDKIIKLLTQDGKWLRFLGCYPWTICIAPK
jgi:hypothetical protein